MIVGNKREKINRVACYEWKYITKQTKLNCSRNVCGERVFGQNQFIFLRIPFCPQCQWNQIQLGFEEKFALFFSFAWINYKSIAVFLHSLTHFIGTFFLLNLRIDFHVKDEYVAQFKTKTEIRSKWRGAAIIIDFNAIACIETTAIFHTEIIRNAAKQFLDASKNNRWNNQRNKENAFKWWVLINCDFDGMNHNLASFFFVRVLPKESRIISLK